MLAFAQGQVQPLVWSTAFEAPEAGPVPGQPTVLESARDWRPTTPTTTPQNRMQPQLTQCRVAGPDHEAGKQNVAGEVPALCDAPKAHHQASQQADRQPAPPRGRCAQQADRHQHEAGGCMAADEGAVALAMFDRTQCRRERRVAAQCHYVAGPCAAPLLFQHAIDRQPDPDQ